MLTNIQDGIVHIETGNVTEQIKMELSEKWYSERLFCHDNQSYGLDFLVLRYRIKITSVQLELLSQN